MRRFTILGLMGVVLGVAVAIAALRNADDYWAGALLLTTAMLIGVATLGACYQSGRRGAGQLGFAVFAGGYFALAFLGLSPNNLAKLPTSLLLHYVHERVEPPRAYIVTLNTIPQQSVVRSLVLNSQNPLPWDSTITTTANSQTSVVSGISGDPSARWKSLLPGAANYDAFGVVGHSLFALLAGLLGMVIARRYQARQG